MSLDPKINRAVDLVEALTPAQKSVLDLTNQVMAILKANGVHASQELADAFQISLGCMKHIGGCKVEATDDNAAVLSVLLQMRDIFFPTEIRH